METSSSTKLVSKYDKLRVYRAITDEFFKLKKIYQDTKRFSELFKPRVVQLRHDLKKHCELLMFEESAEYGVKSEDLLWRCVYHNLMKCYQQHHSLARSRELSLLLAHLQCGVGHYYSLLLRFVNEYDLKVQRVLPEFWQSSHFAKEFDQVRSQVSFAKTDEINRCVHKILIHMGDLYRYMDSLGQENCRLMAAKWYNAAILYDWSDGMPFNQLGTLAFHENSQLEAAFYYMRCLTSETSFDGAESNLRTIFNNARLLQKDEKKIKGIESAMQVRKCLSEFLSVVSDFWGRCEHLYQLETRIVYCLNSIKDALEFPVKQNNSNKPLYLNPTIVFQMGVILLMLVEKFKPNQIESSDQNHMLQRASIGFTLNFFYYIVSANTNSIKSKKIVEERSRSENSTPESRENVFSKNCDLNSKRTLARVLRRRALVHFDNSEITHLQIEDEEDDLNELEETAMSAIDALEMSSDLSEAGSLCGNFEEEDESTNSMATSEDDFSQPSSQQNLNESKNTEATLTFTIRKFLIYLYFETNLPTVKILCNWLMSNPEIIRQHADVLGSLLKALVEIFNFLLELEEKAVVFNPDYEKLRFKNNWTQKYPLSVDMALIGFQQLGSFHKRHLDFSRFANHKLSDDELGFLCIQSILSFGHFLTDGLGQTKIMFDYSNKKFFILKTEQPSLSLNLSQPKSKRENLIDHTFSDSNSSLSNTSFNQVSNSFFSPSKNITSSSQAKTAFDFNNTNFLNKHFSMLGDFNRQINEGIMPNMAHLWLDSNENQINSDTNAPLNKRKDFCSQALTSA